MIALDSVEARVLGSLVEKSATTPELYPLTLNALANACNQKTSREPVMSLGHPEVEAAVDRLIEKGLAARRFEAGARAAKTEHKAQALTGSEDPRTLALVCVLLLRGPQTVGELKTRTERLCAFADLGELEALLKDLSGRPGGPFVEKLPRQPGQKEARWRELFTAGAEPPREPAAAPAPAPAAAAPAEERLAALERRVAALEAALAAGSGAGPTAPGE